MGTPQLELRIFGNPVPVEPETISVNATLGQIGTLTCSVRTEFASLIQVGQLVELYEAKDEDSIFKRIWSGQVSTNPQTLDYNGSNQWLLQVTAQDVNAIPSRINSAPEVWPQDDDKQRGGLYVGAIVRKITQHYLGDDAISYHHVKDGPKIDAYTIDVDQYISEIFDDLARIATGLTSDLARWVWFIDQDRDVHFFPLFDEMATVSIGGQNGDLPIMVPADGGYGQMQMLSFMQTDEQTVTRLILRLGHYVLDPVTEYFSPTGFEKAWNLTHPCDSEPIIKYTPPVFTDEDYAPYADVQTVGIQGLDNPPDGPGADFYWNAGSPTIYADNPPPEFSVIEVTYVGQDTRKIKLEDKDGIKRIQSVAGGSGIRARIIDLNDVTTSSDLKTLGLAFLSKFSGLSEILKVRVYDVEKLRVQELQIGQMIYCDPEGLSDIKVTGSEPAGYYLIRAINMSDQEGYYLWRELELVRGPILYDSVEYLNDAMQQAAPAARKTAQPTEPRHLQAKFDAPAPDQIAALTRITMGGTPYLGTAEIETAGTGSDYKIDWEYNNDDPEDPTKWITVFPEFNHVVIGPITIDDGTTVARDVKRFKPGVEFYGLDAGRKISAQDLDDPNFVAPKITFVRSKIISGPSNGVNLTAHLLWR